MTTKTNGGAATKKKYRNFPAHTLKEAMRVAQTVRDENAGKPMNKLLLADAMEMSPSSSNFRGLLSSAYKYGLIDGTEKSTDIGLTDLGGEATAADPGAKQAALRRAVQNPEVFRRFMEEFNQAKLPSPEMLPKTLVTTYEVPQDRASECADLLVENGRWVGLVVDLTGGPRVMLDAAPLPSVVDEAGEEAGDAGERDPQGVEEAATAIGPVVDLTGAEAPPMAPPAQPAPAPAPSKILFVGHGKNHGPLEKIEKFLTKYGLPSKVAEEEPNAGRPIPTKVRDVMRECGAAILIFTKDELFFDKDGNEVWRPSENVVYELGAASLLYENRIVIFKEKGVRFPTNYESVGYIEFEEDQIEAKTSDLLGELIALGLVKVSVS